MREGWGGLTLDEAHAVVRALPQEQTKGIYLKPVFGWRELTHVLFGSPLQMRYEIMREGNGG